MTQLILASTSAIRRQMLRDAGVPLDGVCDPGVDEAAIKSLCQGVSPGELAARLAGAKALACTDAAPDAMIIGADQVLALDDGRLIDKPGSPAEAVDHLRAMSGRRHSLNCAVAVMRGGETIWRHDARADMDVRNLSDAFVADYVARHWDTIRFSVGCYRIEGEGAQLFSRIEGSQFTVMGLPLLPLLGFLRDTGVMPS